MTQNDASSADSIRATGRRLTTQRVVVMDTIRELQGHVTVEQIAARLHEAYPQIDTATVYRTVGLLSRLHLINEVSVGGISRYEYAEPGHQHGHMVCEHCGTTFHLEPLLSRRAAGDAAAGRGFRASYGAFHDERPLRGVPGR